MKRNVFSAGLLLLALSVSCARMEMDAPVKEAGPVFYAEIEQSAGADTKVYADDNLSILWHAGDLVSIFNRYTYNSQYRFTGETGDNAGSFEEVATASVVTGNELDYVYAVYPYRAANRISNQGVMSVSLPAVQNYAVKSFDPAANLMVSVSDDNKLLFKNAGGILVVKLFGRGVKVASVSLKGNDEEVVAGNASVKMVPGGVPTLSMFRSGPEEVTVSAPADEPVSLGSSAENATEFWFVLPPMTFKKGFTVTVTDAAGEKFTKSTDKQVTIARSKMSRMAAFKVELAADEDGEEQELPEKVFEYDELPALIHVTWEDMNARVFEPLDLSQETFYQYYSGVVVTSEVDKVYTMDESRIDSKNKHYMELVTADETEGFDEYEKVCTWPNTHAGIYGGFFWSGYWSGGDYATTTDWAYVVLDPDILVRDGDTVQGMVTLKVLSKDTHIYPNIIIRLPFAVKHEHEWVEANPDYLAGQDAEGRNIAVVKGHMDGNRVEFSASNREHFKNYLQDAEFGNHVQLSFSLKQDPVLDNKGNITGFTPNSQYWVSGGYPTFVWNEETGMYEQNTSTLSSPSARITGSTYLNQKIAMTVPLIGDTHDYIVTMQEKMQNGFYCFNEYVVRFKNIFTLTAKEISLPDAILPSTVDASNNITVKDDSGKVVFDKGEVTDYGYDTYGLTAGDFMDITYEVKNDVDVNGVSFGYATLEFDGSELTWQNLGTSLARDKKTIWWPAFRIRNWVGFNIPDPAEIFPKPFAPTTTGKVTIKAQ